MQATWANIGSTIQKVSKETPFNKILGDLHGFSEIIAKFSGGLKETFSVVGATFQTFETSINKLQDLGNGKALQGIRTFSGKNSDGSKADFSQELGGILAVVGAAGSVIGSRGRYFSNLNKKKLQKISDTRHYRSNQKNDECVDRGAGDAYSRPSMLPAERQSAIALSGQKGGDQQLPASILEGIDQQVAQLKAQQKQILDSFQQQIGLFKFRRPGAIQPIPSRRLPRHSKTRPVPARPPQTRLPI